eukprot:474610_1
MATLFLMVLFVITSVTSSTNDSFYRLPQDIQALICSYFTSKQHYSIRRLNRESQHLFVKLHATKSDEMNSWMQLKQFLSQLNMTTELCHHVNPEFCSFWPLFREQLEHYTAFVKPFCCNFTANQIAMIEKLFCVIISNSKLETSRIQYAVARQLHWTLHGQIVHASAVARRFYNDNLFGECVRTMMSILKLRVRIDLAGPSQWYSHFSTTFAVMWEYAICEKRKTGNVENRYTLFAVAYMQWILDTTYGISEVSIAQELVDSLWNLVPDVEFIHYFLSFEQLLIHPILKNHNQRRLIALIMDDVFAANCTFQPKHLVLFCKRKCMLWDLEYVIQSAAAANRYCWSSMKQLLHWVFEYKLSVETYDPIDVMDLFIWNGIFTMDDILCEMQMEQRWINIVSFDLLKRIIDCKESVQHKERLRRWMVLNHTTMRDRANHNCVLVVDGDGNVEMTLKQPKQMFSTIHQKSRKNKHSCCEVM